jgi:hypothetical protein
MTVWVVWGGAFWFWLGTHVLCGKLYDGREGAASNVLSFPLHLGSTLHFATRLAWGSSDLHVNMETPKNSPCSATSLEYDEAHCQVRPLEVFVVSVSVVNCHSSDEKVPDSAVMTTRAGSILVMDYS